MSILATTNLADFDHPGGHRVKMWPSGVYFDLERPSSGDVYVCDIAWHLAHIYRFNGGTAAGYSVAEHSMSVAQVLHRLTGDEDLALAGLFHDAHEAYIGDISRPMKLFLSVPLLSVMEDHIDAAICLALRLPLHPSDERVKQVDSEILAWEMAMIRDSRVRIAPDPVEVAKQFAAMAEDLGCHAS